MKWQSDESNLPNNKGLIALVINLYFLPFSSSNQLTWPVCNIFIYREKSLRHVAMVEKFRDENKPKTSLKKWIRTVSNFIDFIWTELVTKCRHENIFYTESL